jgi:hypothetical protein
MLPNMAVYMYPIFTDLRWRGSRQDPQGLCGNGGLAEVMANVHNTFSNKLAFR